PGEQPGLLMKPDTLRQFLERFESSRAAGETVACLVREHDVSARSLSLGGKPDDAPVRALGGVASGVLPRISWHTVARPLMSAIARQAFWAARAGRLQSPGELDAYYLRRSDAEMHWKES
ncbi:MAG TPA: hypothetical protein VKU44_04735, partial [Terriglobia bacterium]|nr:hypothetical protein [Terriglobia bacterium]